MFALLEPGLASSLLCSEMPFAPPISMHLLQLYLSPGHLKFLGISRSWLGSHRL